MELDLAGLDFRCNLGRLIKRAKINQKICGMEAGLNKATVSRLVMSKSIQKIDSEVTLSLMRYFKCSFEDVWTITTIIHNSDSFNEVTG